MRAYLDGIHAEEAERAQDRASDLGEILEGLRATGQREDFQSSNGLGSVDFPAESSPIPLDEDARGRATDSLLATLDLADQIARRLDLPRVRIRIANARKAVPR